MDQVLKFLYIFVDISEFKGVYLIDDYDKEVGNFLFNVFSFQLLNIQFYEAMSVFDELPIEFVYLDALLAPHHEKELFKEEQESLLEFARVYLMVMVI